VNSVSRGGNCKLKKNLIYSVLDKENAMKRLILLMFFICCTTTLSLDAEARTKQKTAKPKPSATQKKATDTMPEYLPSATAAANAPLSEAVRVGNMLYLSGQLGFLPGTRNLAPGGIAAETKQTMENIRTVLEKHGSSFDRVVKCTVMLADIKERDAMSEIYVTYFAKGRMPARSAFGTSGLAANGRVEIECMATIK
jgi:2-iminobutanoate/2-iminopropanoate deaminase